MLNNGPPSPRVPQWFRWLSRQRSILIIGIGILAGLLGLYRSGLREGLVFGGGTLALAVWALRKNGWADQLSALQKELKPRTSADVIRHPRQRLLLWRFPLAIELCLFAPPILLGSGTWGAKIAMLLVSVTVVLGLVLVISMRWKRMAGGGPKL